MYLESCHFFYCIILFSFSLSIKFRMCLEGKGTVACGGGDGGGGGGGGGGGRGGGGVIS